MISIKTELSRLRVITLKYFSSIIEKNPMVKDFLNSYSLNGYEKELTACFDFWQKKQCLTKILIFDIKPIFDQNFDFW